MHTATSILQKRLGQHHAPHTLLRACSSWTPDETKPTTYLQLSIGREGSCSDASKNFCPPAIQCCCSAARACELVLEWYEKQQNAVLGPNLERWTEPSLGQNCHRAEGLCPAQFCTIVLTPIPSTVLHINPGWELTFRLRYTPLAFSAHAHQQLRLGLPYSNSLIGSKNMGTAR